MRKRKAGLWATIIASGLLTTACVGDIREERAIFKRDYSIGNLAVSSRDIAWSDDDYKIKLKGSEGKDQLDITVLQRMLRDFKFVDKEGMLYKIGVSHYKDKGVREAKKLFQKETDMGTLTVYERDIAWASDDYKIELKGDKGILEVIALKGYGLDIQFTGKDGTVYRLHE